MGKHVDNFTKFRLNESKILPDTKEAFLGLKSSPKDTMMVRAYRLEDDLWNVEIYNNDTAKSKYEEMTTNDIETKFNILSQKNEK